MIRAVCAAALLAAPVFAQCISPTNTVLPDSATNTYTSGTTGFGATSTITAAGSNTSLIVTGTANVTLTAGSSITLQQGFHATALNGGATFKAQIAPVSQYQATATPWPSSGGSVTLTPCSQTGYFGNGTTVTFQASAANGYGFTGWSGGLSGTTNPQTIAIAGPLNVTANFTSGLISETITTQPSSLSITVDGSAYTSPRTFQWQAGSQHTITASSPQSSGGTQYVFSNWSDGSPQTHSINASPTTDLAVFALSSAYAPTVTEINLGGVPIDNYTSTNGSQLPNCNSSLTVQQCIRSFFNGNPNVQPYLSDNYIGQGVTGVRFQFALGGGFNSHPFDSNGNVQSAWVNNLQAFLNDLHSYGVQRVTLTPAMGGGWGDPLLIVPGASGTPYQNDPPVYGCDPSVPLEFYPWMPFGFRQDNGYADCLFYNDAYNSANAAINPNTIPPNKNYFWGWTPFFNLMNAVFGAIKNAGLQLAELDIENEVALGVETVFGRLIYDNINGVDVIETLRSNALSSGLNCVYDPTACRVITVSVPQDRPTVAAYDCGSVYGDSAYYLEASELLAAYAGPYSVIGYPAPGFSLVTNGLVCGGNTTGMISLPVYHQQPPVIIDNHVYPCVNMPSGACDKTQDATSTALQMYNDLWTFLQYRGLTGGVAMMGETQSGQDCDGYTPVMATQNVNGYTQSTLFANHASLTTMRTWNNEGDESHCYAIPTPINPPY